MELKNKIKTKNNLFQKGKKNPMFGIKNEKHPSWKGDLIGYDGVHKWIYNNKIKPDRCEKCKNKRALEISNISGKYKRDINDFEWLCKSCHRKKDIGKLSDEDVKDIRSSCLFQKELSIKYNVNQSTISRIKNNKRRIL